MHQRDLGTAAFHGGTLASPARLPQEVCVEPDSPSSLYLSAVSSFSSLWLSCFWQVSDTTDTMVPVVVLLGRRPGHQGSGWSLERGHSRAGVSL